VKIKIAKEFPVCYDIKINEPLVLIAICGYYKNIKKLPSGRGKERNY